ncbi:MULTISPECIES: NAD(P)/FAD-dependent oxidoreductase [unclassified Streptomyces]|uniref:NAD(P)/FAD-dependent oxidoreductase n=1 Tax=unclassified Streptomyces TaxID=2593676 RepID=UPI000370FBD9|nr:MULTISPECIES: NAD(P)/FAD-dependent oxidoreductase [unclassified Streptomyces]MYT29245.1 FAD-dependent oxidoreductase [Streptomyces sp. SID8354]
METQVAIVGGGPGGSACAIHLAQRSIRSVVVERETFPRFHIGESLTGDSGDLLREMGLEERVAALRPPVKYGITVFGPHARHQFFVPIKGRGEHGLYDSTSWQVRRADFDTMMLERAREAGAEVVKGRASEPLMDGDRVVGVRVRLDSGEVREIRSDVLVDASGQKTFLANAGLAGPKRSGAYARQMAVYSHFTGAVRDEGPAWGNTLTFFREKYQWCWFIPLDSETTSIGFVIPTDYFHGHDESPTEFVRRELREFNSELARRTEDVTMVEDVHVTTNYSYTTERFSGPGWVCIGDAHRFVDPLFSYGLNITVAESRRVAQDIALLFSGEITDTRRPFAAFEEWSRRGTEVAQTMLDGFWESTFTFGMLIREEEDGFIDLFSGRLWMTDNPALPRLEAALVRSRERRPDVVTA